jgi:GAF domain-containing protein
VGAGYIRAGVTAQDHLADEHAALRRVATLMARGATPEELFAVVAEQVAHVLGVTIVSVARYEDDGTAVRVLAEHAPHGSAVGPGVRVPTTDGETVVARVWRTGVPARIDDYDDLPGPIAAACRRIGVQSSAGVPIAVAGDRLWGVIAVSSTTAEGPLPPDTEARLAGFAELAATALADGEARAELRRLAQEQAALRRVATLVAEGASQDAVFATIGRECAELFGAGEMRLVRFEEGPSQVVVAAFGRSSLPFPVGSRQPLGGTNTATMVHATGRAARMDDYSRHADGTIGTAMRAMGVRSVVATPIHLGGRLWGAMGLGTTADPLPAGAEHRLGQFTDLMATAIGNAEARAQAERLADEQAALRRIAIMVAEEAPQNAVFQAIAQECLRLFGSEEIRLMRYEEGPSQVIAAASGTRLDPLPVGLRTPLGGNNGATRVHETGRAVRIDDYEREATGPLGQTLAPSGVVCVVATPIVVEGRLWGAMGAASRRAPLPPETEERLGQFTDLMATAIANTEARDRAQRLTDEQAALRRVATLVAHEAPAEEVFARVASEVAVLLGVESAAVLRHDEGDRATVVGRWGPELPSAATAPITVDGRLWGVMAVGTTRADPLPADAEARIAEFSELVGTAIANLQARSDLAASRARVVAASDETRRQIERDLHDGAQQRLVETVLKLRVACEVAETDAAAVPELLDEALDGAERAMDELSELVHGILPPVLVRGGLPSALRSLARRTSVPVDADVAVGRFAADVEATAYFVVAEALTNVVKHAHASAAWVTAHAEDGVLHVAVRDDGAGGAHAGGSGLLGLADRLAVLDGRLTVESPPGGGTVVAAAIPLAQPGRGSHERAVGGGDVAP